MTDTLGARRHRAPPGTRFFGSETEYGFATLGADGERVAPVAGVERLMREAKKIVAHLPCSGETDVFTANGSRVYIDAGLHPEVATPECSTPEEIVLFTRAGDRLLARAAKAVGRGSCSAGAEALLWKANVDHRSGATWASHESYLHEAPQSLLAEQLMSHLVTRIVYTGAGGFDNRAAALRFVVSPRAFHLEKEISSGSTRERGIFHTRNEPLADPPCQRLHVLCGETLWSQTADYLRIGATALLIAQIDAGRRPQAGLDLAFPLEALATIAADVHCTATVNLRTSGSHTAIAIQRRLLENVEADLGAEHLPFWAPQVCTRWRSVLDRLEASPCSLIGVLDWPTKLAVLERQCEAHGIEWTFSDAVAGDPARAVSSRIPRDGGHPLAARLLETDMRFNRLDDTGIFATLERQNALAHRVVTASAVAKALHTPPSLGRARIRAACVETFADRRSAISCYWDRIIDHKRKKAMLIGDPFQCEGAQWTPLPPHLRRSRRALERSAEPIAHALAAGAPRQALCHMRTLLERSERLSPAVYRYCTSVVARLIPIWPVPVLRRGAATAGPVLELLLEHALRNGERAHEESVGTCLYRFYEARGCYQHAQRVVERLLERAREASDGHESAVLTNNLGYLHLLAGEWAAAEALFDRAMELYTAHGSTRDMLNAHANLLESRFAQTESEHWGTLLVTLKEVNRALLSVRDWRARKTLRLLARFAEQRGKLCAARGWMRRAIAVSQDIPTQLRDWDRAYLRALEARCSASSRTQPP